MKRAIREHLRDFLAITALFVLGLATMLVIFTRQNAIFPSWVPGLGEDRFELTAQFRSAQAVTPGQGQTVNIAGIKVGDVTEVTVEDGDAVITMSVEPEYAPLIRENASMLLRPRTGLQDMTVEVDPGTGDAPPVEEGAEVPMADTQPQVQPDQILASLDADTREYLQLLLEGGGRGIGDNGVELSSVLRRFEPTARDLAKITGKLSQRRENIRRSITNFADLSEELGARDSQLAGFVSSSNQVLESFASQEANIRGTLQEAPGALAATRGALESGDRLALELGPTSQRLVPWARALGPALEETRPFFRETVDPIRTQIRPFTRQVDEPVRHLRQLSDELNRTTPPLTRAFGDVNRLFNALAYNPPGAEEGFLFYLPWINHNLNSVSSIQDAHGPVARTLVTQSCTTAKIAEGIAATTPRLQALLDLTRVPQSTVICPLDP